MGPGLGRGQLRRIDVERLLAYAAMEADATVIDVGCLMDSAAGLQLATLADTVVLVVSNRAAATSIDSARRYLAPAEALVLPVWAELGRARSVWSRAGFRRSRGVDEASPLGDVVDIDGDVVDDIDGDVVDEVGRGVAGNRR